jgi:hypothetical protein
MDRMNSGLSYRSSLTASVDWRNARVANEVTRPCNRFPNASPKHSLTDILAPRMARGAPQYPNTGQGSIGTTLQKFSTRRDTFVKDNPTLHQR